MAAKGILGGEGEAWSGVEGQPPREVARLEGASAPPDSIAPASLIWTVMSPLDGSLELLQLVSKSCWPLFLFAGAPRGP